MDPEFWPIHVKLSIKHKHEKTIAIIENMHIMTKETVTKSDYIVNFPHPDTKKTILMAACEKDKLDIIKFITQSNNSGNINSDIHNFDKKGANIEMYDNQGYTALYYAVHRNFFNDGNIIRQNYYQVIKCLLKNGAFIVNYISNDDILHYLAKTTYPLIDYEIIFKYIHKYKKDVNLKNKYYKTAIDYAFENKNERFINGITKFYNIDLNYKLEPIHDNNVNRNFINTIVENISNVSHHIIPSKRNNTDSTVAFNDLDTPCTAQISSNPLNAMLESMNRTGTSSLALFDHNNTNLPTESKSDPLYDIVECINRIEFNTSTYNNQESININPPMNPPMNLPINPHINEQNIKLDCNKTTCYTDGVTTHPNNSSEIKSNTIYYSDNDGENKFVCCICLENEKTIMLRPCNHICTCSECSDKIEKCPICRTFIENKEHVFIS
jgi:hypothetical protein